MGMTNDEIDAEIARLEALRPGRVRWAVFDRDGDGMSYMDETAARKVMESEALDGSFSPYTLYRCEEVK